jgi:hypothetical protein
VRGQGVEHPRGFGERRRGVRGGPFHPVDPEETLMLVGRRAPG